MKIRSNSLMTETLEKKIYNFLTENVSLPIELIKLIDAGFRTEQDCILFKEFNNIQSELIDSDEKKTEFECFINDIHIDDYLTNISDEFEYLKVGLEFSKTLYDKLNDNFEKDFRITVSYDETTFIDEEINTYGGCVVKFHTIRPSCDYKFRINNLNEFKYEGVLEIE